MKGPIRGHPKGEPGGYPSTFQPEPGLEPQRGRETKWQEFSQSLEAPHCTHVSIPESEAAPWDDAKAFLASFEQVAAAYGWPRREWVARLLPTLSGGAQQAFSLLAAPERVDYVQVKAAILRGEALRREKRRQHFRQFCCPQLGDPPRMYSRVQELCCQWLEPERHSKEQILELLVLEQFLASLPGDIQSRIRACGPDSGAEAVALLEDFMMNQREAEAEANGEPLQEWAVGPLELKVECLDMEQVEDSREPAEILRDPKQSLKEEASHLGLEKEHTASVLPQEGQDVGEDELSGASGHQVKQEMNLREEEMSFHQVEQTPLQSSQQPTFWKVLQQDENEGSLDDGQRTWLHRKNPQLGGKRLEEVPRQRIPENPQMISAEEQPFWYPEWEADLSLGSYFSTQERNPTEGKSHTCPDCGKRFTRSYGLWKHRIIHTGKKPHQCLECGKSFTWRSSLLNHMSTHSGVKPHKCVLCGRSFSQKSHLLRHETVHTGEKPHKCQLCGKRFSRRSHLLRHQAIHTQG